MKRVYCRCNGGDYFVGGGFCPLDSWSSAESMELAQAVQRLASIGQEPSIEQVRQAGVSEETLARSIVIDFGSDASAFELLAPRGYIVDGEWRPVDQLREHRERFM